MRTVLITGSDGFIGRNLRFTLQKREDLRLLCFDVQDDPNILKPLLDESDIVFHLAGINRPTYPEEYTQGNSGLTRSICDHLLERGRTPAIILTSSTQAALENPYGISKLAAEETVFAYGKTSGAPVHVFRLPNVFGKWCRPNYNSAVATFCHNIARDLPIQVNDPAVELKLVHIDDVMQGFARLLDASVEQEDGFSLVKPVYAVKLGKVAELIRSFRDTRSSIGVPDLSDPFVNKLYSTYLSYLPTDDFSYPLKMNTDQRGSFTEFIRTPDRGQVSVNISKPGITKGNHWHHTKNEKFLVVSGNGVIRFRKVGTDEVIEYTVSGEKLEVVDIPPGYTHNITNSGSGDMVTVMWCNESFDPGKPDTNFEQVEGES